MLLPTTSVLRELLIRELASAPNQTAGVVLASLQKRGHSFSKQGVYKELRQLESQGVVTRAQGKYSLSLTWVLMLVSLADQMYDQYIEALPLESILPPANESARWNFNSLIRLLDFWTQVIFLLFQRSESKLFSEWVPHPWFVLVQREKTLSLFLEAIRIGKFSVRAIIGGQTYLDLAFSNSPEMPKELYQCAFADSPFHHDRGLYLGTVDEFLIAVRLDAETTQRIDEFYSSVAGPEDVTPQRIGGLFSQSGKYVLTIERATSRSRKVSRQFSEYFGFR